MAIAADASIRFCLVMAGAATTDVTTAETDMMIIATPVETDMMTDVTTAGTDTTTAETGAMIAETDMTTAGTDMTTAETDAMTAETGTIIGLGDNIKRAALAALFINNPIRFEHYTIYSKPSTRLSSFSFILLLKDVISADDAAISLVDFARFLVLPDTLSTTSSKTFASFSILSIA